MRHILLRLIKELLLKTASIIDIWRAISEDGETLDLLNAYDSFIRVYQRISKLEEAGWKHDQSLGKRKIAEFGVSGRF